MSWTYISASQHIRFHCIATLHFSSRRIASHYSESHAIQTRTLRHLWYCHVFYFRFFSDSVSSRWNPFEIGSCFKLCISVSHSIEIFDWIALVVLKRFNVSRCDTIAQQENHKFRLIVDSKTPIVGLFKLNAAFLIVSFDLYATKNKYLFGMHDVCVCVCCRVCR